MSCRARVSAIAAESGGLGARPGPPRMTYASAADSQLRQSPRGPLSAARRRPGRACHRRYTTAPQRRGTHHA